MENDYDHNQTRHIQLPPNNMSVNSSPNQQFTAPPAANYSAASAPPYLLPPPTGFPINYPVSATNQQLSAPPGANHLHYDQQRPSETPYILPSATGFPMGYPASFTNQEFSASPGANHLHYDQQYGAAAAPFSTPSINPQPQVAIVQYFSAPPAAPQLHFQAPVPWSTGLYDCFSDLSSCCLTYWLPCVTFGLIAETVDNGATSCLFSASCYVLIALLIGFPNLYSFTYRSRMRHQYMLEGSSCDDCMVHFFCEPCALCQEYRELQNRQLENGTEYVQQQNGVMAMTPSAPRIEPGMRR